MKAKEIKFIENLLKGYKHMKSERVNLNIQWNMLERQKNHAIEGQFMKANVLTDMPGSPMCGYKQQAILLPKGWDYQQICDEQTFIVDRLKDLEDILTMMDSSLNSLSNQEKDIVLMYYVSGYSLEKIARIVYVHPDNVSKKKYFALKALYGSLKSLEGTITFREAS